MHQITVKTNQEEKNRFEENIDHLEEENAKYLKEYNTLHVKVDYLENLKTEQIVEINRLKEKLSSKSTELEEMIIKYDAIQRDKQIVLNQKNNDTISNNNLLNDENNLNLISKEYFFDFGKNRFS